MWSATRLDALFESSAVVQSERELLFSQLVELIGRVVTRVDRPGLKSFMMVYRQRTIGEQESTEIAYFISSHAPKVRALAGHIRGHWSTENSQHYVLDVIFAEDASRIRKCSAPEISSAIRRMSLNILQLDTTVKDNIRGKRLRAGWDEQVLAGMWSAFCQG